MSKKENKSIWRYFKRVFYGLIMIAFLYTIFSSNGTLGINKTVGWGWDFTNWVWWIAVVFFVIQIFALIFFTSFLIKLFVELFKKNNSKTK